METPGWLLSGLRRRTGEARAHLPPRRRWTIAMLLLGLAVLPGAVRAAADRPIAIVDGEAIGEAEFSRYLRGYLRSKLYHGGSPERVRELAGEALESIIAEHLLAAEAERRGIEGDRDTVARELAAIRARNVQRPDWPEIEAILPEIEAALTRGARIEALRAEISAVAPPSEAELRDFHAANPALFTEPPAFDLDLILLGVPPSALASDWAAALARAAEIRAAIDAGDAFASLARLNSAHLSGPEGGRLGRVHLGQLPAAAEAAVAALAPGEVSPPVRLLEGVAIFRVNAREAARLQPFETVRERAEGLYLRHRAALQWADFVAGLRAAAPVEAFDLGAAVQQFLAPE